MRVAICDDDLIHCASMERYLLEISEKFMDLKVDIDVYQSGEELLKIIEIEKERPQILFLDMEMKEINGIQTAQRLRVCDRSMIIIYVTSYDKYTLDSFEVSPFRYLLKPVDYEKIQHVFISAVDKILNDFTSVIFKYNNRQLHISCEEIIAIISENGRMLRVLTRGEQSENLFYDRIKNVEKQLNPFKFIKVNQGTIINLDYVYIISRDEVRLSTGEIFTISRRRMKAVKEAYNLYVKRRIGVCL